MGNEVTTRRKRTLSNDPILGDYRWFWNNVFLSWDHVNTNEYWHPFPLELCEDIEESYLTKFPYHYKDKIILFDYKNLKHLQIVQSNAWKKKLILRENPTNLIVSRIKLLNNFSPIKIEIEEEYNRLFIKEMGILFLKDAFANIQYDPNDEFSYKFMNSRKMITAKLIRFIFKSYKYRIDNLIHGKQYFSFEILKSMLLYDFEDKKCYRKYYLNKLTKDNFSKVILDMLLEENSLYKEIIEFPFNCNENNIYLTTYYICFCYALSEKEIKNIDEYKAYLVSTENQILFKPNEFYYNKNTLLASKNGFNGLKEFKTNKIIFEITVPKEPKENSYLNQRPFDISTSSIYNDEVVLFPTYSCFYIESIKTYFSRPTKNRQIATTIISMRVIQNVLNTSIPLMTDGDKAKFGIYEEYARLTEEQINSVLYAKIKTRHIKYTRKMVNCISMELYGNNVTLDEITSLSDNIKTMPNLQSLSIVGNDICGKGYKVLNNSFKCIPLLQYLNLSFNLMRDEDLSVFQFSLLEKLEFLLLRVNQITNIGMVHLINELKHCKYLRGLDLYDNNIGDNGLEEITKEIASFPYLQSIDLWNCGITNKGVISLLEHLYNHQEIESINIKHNPINGDELVSYFIHSVKTMPKLRLMSITQNDFSFDQLDTIVRNYQMVNPQWTYDSSLGALLIQSSSINTTHYYKNRQADLFWLKPCKRLYRRETLKIKSIENLLSILKNISKYFNVNTINLEEAQIDNSGLVILSDIITKLPFLEKLYLSFNQFDATGIEFLSPRLNALDTLKVLDLSSNGLGDDGLKALSMGISKCPLQEIILCWNNISNKGIKELMSRIDNLKRLLVLDLFGNNISDEGIDFISANSHCLRELTTLNLGKNKIGNQGMSEFAECFNNFLSLSYLNLCDNKFDNEGIYDFLHNLSNVLTLQYLNISGNNITYEKKMAMIEQGIPSSFIL